MRIAVVICALFFSSMVYAELSERDEHLRVILEKTYLEVNSQSLLNLIAAEAIVFSEKTMDTDVLIQKFREVLAEEAIFAKLSAPYAQFSDEEVKELRKIHENPVYEKYSLHSAAVFQTCIQTMKEVLKELAAVHGVEKNAETDQPFIEITKDNFQKEVLECSELVIIDVYSNSCPPCRLMQPVLEDLRRQYSGIIRFVKLNCETEEEITQQLGITHLPTFLFVKPSDKTIYFKISGFMPKKDFQAKIEEFLTL